LLPALDRVDLDRPEGVVSVGGGRIVAPDHRVLARDLATGGEAVRTQPWIFYTDNHYGYTEGGVGA
jgi:hypothetical protein